MASADSNVPSPQSLSTDDSEESFVVLCNSAEPEDSIAVTMHTPEMSQSVVNEMVQTITGMSLSTTSEMNPEEIQTKLEDLLRENVELKETLHQNNLAMKKQFNTLVMWQEEVKKVHENHKTKFEETKKLIANLRGENDKLKQAISSPSASDEDTLSLNSKISALEYELGVLRQANIQYKNDHTKTVRDLEAKLESKETEWKDLTKKYEAQLESLRNELWVTKDELLASQKKLTEVAKQSPPPSILQTIDTLKDEIKQLKEELNVKNQVVKEKGGKLDELTSELRTLKEKTEMLPIVEIQAEQYRIDFLTEKKEREKIEEQKRQIAEDLRHLQKRNEELMKDVEGLRNNGFVHVNVASPSKEKTPPSSVYTCPKCNYTCRTMKFLEEHIVVFTCPKCNFAFTTHQALRNHIYRCIELDILP